MIKVAHLWAVECQAQFVNCIILSNPKGCDYELTPLKKKEKINDIEVW